MIPAFPVYLFDVDGTLTHSAPDICGAIQAVLSTTRRNNVSDAFLTSYIGLHLIDLFQDLFPEYTPEQIDALIVEYRAIYPTRAHASTTVYPGVIEGLSKLGGRKSTATTKATATARIVLEKFGLLTYFDHVQGTDGFPAKPHPDVILKSLEVFGVTPSDALMIGDAPADMDAGRRAGVRLCAVTYGYGKREELARFAPDYWVDDLRQLLPA